MMAPSLRSSLNVLIVAACAACASAPAGGGGANTGTNTSGNGSTDAGGTAPAPGTNKASVATTSDSGAKSNVEVDKAASKADAEAQSNKLGAVNADKQLVLWISDVAADGTTQVIEVHVNTDKYPLPSTGIPVGAVNSDAWVTFTVAGPTGSGIYTSTGAGTIDISSCPAKSGEVVTGQFNGVVVAVEAVAMGAKSYTLGGSFNLVYFGLDGSLMCKPSSAGGGSVDVSKLQPPAGSTCNANPCDGGSNTTRNCCPYVPCMAPCIYNCSMAVNKCSQDCMADPMNMMGCMQKCVGELASCESACLTSCNVSASCKTAAEAYFGCENKNMDACSMSSDQDVCLYDKCCAEVKAAF